jgi:hypothetical protein
MARHIIKTNYGYKECSEEEYQNTIRSIVFGLLIIFFSKIILKIILYISPWVLIIHLYRFLFDASFLSVFYANTDDEFINILIATVIGALVIHLCFTILFVSYSYFKKIQHGEEQSEDDYEEDPENTPEDEYKNLMRNKLKRAHNIFCCLCCFFAIILFFSEYRYMYGRCISNNDLKACRVSIYESNFLLPILKPFYKYVMTEKDLHKFTNFHDDFQNRCKNGEAFYCYYLAVDADYHASPIWNVEYSKEKSKDFRERSDYYLLKSCQLKYKCDLN